MTSWSWHRQFWVFVAMNTFGILWNVGFIGILVRGYETELLVPELVFLPIGIAAIEEGLGLHRHA